MTGQQQQQIPNQQLPNNQIQQPQQQWGDNNY